MTAIISCHPVRTRKDTIQALALIDELVEIERCGRKHRLFAVLMANGHNYLTTCLCTNTSSSSSSCSVLYYIQHYSRSTRLMKVKKS